MVSACSDRDQVTAARLMNWARWASGGLPDSCARHDEAIALDELDAALVEIAVCGMKTVRPFYWRLVRARYLWRWNAIAAAEYLRRSERQLYRDEDAMLRWLDRALAKNVNPMICG